MPVWEDIINIKGKEYVPLGTFWSLDWDSPDDTLEATVTARDRMELLRKKYIPDQPSFAEQKLYELAEIVLQDAGLTSDEYIIDTELQNIIIPYAWFNPVSHREALRRIAEPDLRQHFRTGTGRYRLRGFSSQETSRFLKSRRMTTSRRFEHRAGRTKLPMKLSSIPSRCGRPQTRRKYTAAMSLSRYRATQQRR